MNPPVDAIALDGLERLWMHLPVAVASGHDAAARWDVMMGAVEASMTTWKGLGYSHALSMPFDDLGLHHGTVVGVLLPHTVSLLRDSVPGDRLDRLARALGLVDSVGLEAALADFTARIGLPSGLGELGVGEGVWPSAAASRNGARSTRVRRGTRRRPTTSRWRGRLSDLGLRKGVHVVHPGRIAIDCASSTRRSASENTGRMSPGHRP